MSHASAAEPREVPSQAPVLPPSLAARLAGRRWSRNLVGQAGAAVYRLHGAGGGDLYLKHGTGDVAGTLADEMLRLRWLSGALPVPALEHFECTRDEAWLLTRALPGRTAYEWLTEAPARAPAIVAALAQFLARMHALPAERCPFTAHHTRRLADARRRIDAGLVDADDFDEARAGWSAEEVWQELMRLQPQTVDAVVTHGDYSLDNILLDADGQITGVIDLDRAGVADRCQDLAILWNCLEEFGPDAQQTLFDAYGVSAPDMRRLQFHLCLDECF